MNTRISPAGSGEAPPRSPVGAGLLADHRTVAVLEQLLNSVPHAVLVKDRAHRWLLINDQMCQLMGYPRETLLGRTDHDFLPKPQADGYWAIDDEVFATGEEREIEETLTAADGSVRWLLTRKRRVNLSDADGLDYPVVIASVMDITEIRRTKNALRESEAHYRSSVELSPQVPWTATADGMVSDAGPRWEALTGVSVDEGLGSGWANRLHPDDLQQAVERWRASVASGEPFDHEFRLRLASGQYRWFRSRAAARRGDDGRILRWYGSLEDIHDRKVTEQALRDSEAFSRSILDHSPNVIRVLDAQGRVIYANPAAYRLLELGTEEEVVGQPWLDFLPPACRVDAQAGLDTASAGGVGQFTIRRQTSDGSPQWLDTMAVALPAEDGSGARWLVISLDVTEARRARDAAEQAQRELRELAERLSTVLESTTDSVMVLDAQWRLTYLNGNAMRALQSREPRLGRCLWDIFPEERNGVFARNYQRAIAERTPVMFEEYVPGLAAWLEVHAYPTGDGLSVFFRNITERRRAEQERLIAQERIAHMSRHDPLTGLPNRLALHDELEQAACDCRGGGNAALLHLDLVGFKAVNDGFSHLAGDALLREVAERLRGCARGNDTVVRFGADEFAILRTRVRGRDDAEQLGRAVMLALAAPFDVDGQRVQIGVSIGIAMMPEHGQTADDLLRAADVALFRARQEGVSAFHFFEPGMDEHLRTRMAHKRALRDAVDKQQLQVVFQPLHRLSTGEVSGFEALLRWRHPERGTISPGDFIPLAEETGLIVQIGKWALEEACRQATQWPSSVCVAVNLSPVQFRDPDLVPSITRALATYGLEPSRLQLEVTESVMLQQNLANLSVLQTLRALGVQIAMDDFGTGYSSLSYLRTFPFDKLKLDRSFVNDLHNGTEARAILHAVAGLGSAFNIRTTAEGIETVSQLAAVRDEGYDEGQGYLFSPPVPGEQTLALIERARDGAWWAKWGSAG